MRWLISSLMLTLAVSTASACLNDVESSRTETEFKSLYNGKPAYKPQPGESSPLMQANVFVTLSSVGLGSILVCGAIVLASRKA
jgi:hypothetical protein